MRLFLTTISLVLAACSQCAFGQFVGLMNGVPTSESLSAPMSGQGVTDMFIGKNTVGPYMLSWKAVESDGFTVSRGIQRLVNGVDYRLDAANGVLTFTNPLRPNQIARVDYRTIPGKALANTGGY